MMAVRSGIARRLRRIAHRIHPQEVRVRLVVPRISEYLR